jgi:hypothetical protein
MQLSRKRETVAVLRGDVAAALPAWLPTLQTGPNLSRRNPYGIAHPDVRKLAPSGAACERNLPFGVLNSEQRGRSAHAAASRRQPGAPNSVHLTVGAPQRRARRGTGLHGRCTAT